jgi:hypothetical protein
MAATVGKYLSSFVQRAQDMIWSTNILQSTFGIVGVVMQHLIKRPCEVIFRNAPGAIGGWEGRSSEDICSQMTGTKAEFWKGDNMITCMDMIQRRFESWFTMVIVLLYAFTLYQVIRLVWYLSLQKLTGGPDARDKPQVQLIYYPLPENQWEDIHHGRKPRLLSS